MRAPLFIFSIIGLLLVPVLTPELDLAIAGLFYHHGLGFAGQNAAAFDFVSTFANYGARFMVLFFLTAFIYSAYRKRLFLSLDKKAWLFLLAALLIGPGLFANTLFKDNWGRARPRQTEAFGGTASFSPALVIAKQCSTNCSFVSGDASFGLFLPCFAFVVAPQKRRRVFGILCGTGILFGLARIVSGAHFFSDVLFAWVLTMGTNIGTYAAFYGWPKTKLMAKKLSGRVVEYRPR